MIDLSTISYGNLTNSSNQNSYSGMEGITFTQATVHSNSQHATLFQADINFKSNDITFSGVGNTKKLAKNNSIIEGLEYFSKSMNKE